MSMITGVVIEKEYLPPPGAPYAYWCYLTVEPDDGERKRILLSRKLHDKIVIGDRISYKQPWRKFKRIGDVELLGTMQLG